MCVNSSIYALLSLCSLKKEKKPPKHYEFLITLSGLLVWGKLHEKAAIQVWGLFLSLVRQSRSAHSSCFSSSSVDPSNLKSPASKDHSLAYEFENEVSNANVSGNTCSSQNVETHFVFWGKVLVNPKSYIGLKCSLLLSVSLILSFDIQSWGRSFSLILLSWWKLYRIPSPGLFCSATVRLFVSGCCGWDPLLHPLKAEGGNHKLTVFSQASA